MFNNKAYNLKKSFIILKDSRNYNLFNFKMAQFVSFNMNKIETNVN